MKSKFAFLVVLFATFALVSCSEKDLYDENRVEKKVGDLNVSSNFDWNLVSNVTCNFTATTATRVAVYMAKPYDDNSLIAEYYLGPDTEDLTLPVPAYVTKLYVKAGDNEPVEVLIEKGIASFNFATTRSGSGPILPGDYEDGTDFAWVYFPSKCGMATVLFEDNFPVVGDYDFNDFVANYSYVAKLSKQQGGGKDPAKFHVVNIDFKVRVKALGGEYDYTPYLRVLGMKVDNANGFSGDGATIMTGTDSDPIVRIDGHTKKPAGSQFLNTKIGDTPVNRSALKVVKFSITANNKTGTGVKQEDLKFDFYLKGVGHLGSTYEIHQKGFDPVDEAYYPSDNTGLGTTRYTTDKNLVWAFTVPADVKHAIEYIDFLKAYPGFEAWVTSSTLGDQTMRSNWYNNGNPDHLFTIPE